MIADCRRKAVVKSLILKGISLLLITSGCAVVAPAEDPTLAFAAAGKFGIQDADRGYSARFSWRHYTNRYDIEVWGPLGQGRTSLTGNAQNMRVRRGGEVLASGDPHDVMLANLGWSVPIEILPAWLQGFPASRLPYADAVLDEEGRYVGFTQAGWLVQLQRYGLRNASAAGVWTPGRIVASMEARKVTVVVREYMQ